MRKELKSFFDKSIEVNKIDNSLYDYYAVKKGLRNEDGTGVLVGLTKISDVVGYKLVNDEKIDDEGVLYYRGIDVSEIVELYQKDRYLYEKVCFLILFGFLPYEKEFDDFQNVLSYHYDLPEHYLEDNILRKPSRNLMNKLQQEILMLYEYDDDPDNNSVEQTLEKGIDIIAKLPAIICYSYQAQVHHFYHKNLFIHQTNKRYSIAESLFYLLRNDGLFTDKEVEVLNIALILHADHGGGNNSTFTNVVISSTGTDIYSSISGAIGSLKGPRHGGANLAVKKQMDLVIDEIGLDASDEQMKKIINRILNKDYNDYSGLVYGIGHAVYTLSDPRSEILSCKCYELSLEKGMQEKYSFYQRFAHIAICEIEKRKGIHVCTNVDFYSGLLYDMLGIPSELFPLLFVAGRIVGWIAHNMENKLYANKIVRPATRYVGEMKKMK